MGIVKVVCGIIISDGRIFLCRRNAGKSLAGHWEFPGGKVEPGEEAKQALLRELQEELGMQVNVDRHFKTVVHAYDHITIELTAYICRFLAASYIMTDHDRYEWVDRSALTTWQLAPADVPIAEELEKPDVCLFY